MIFYKKETEKNGVSGSAWCVLYKNEVSKAMHEARLRAVEWCRSNALQLSVAEMREFLEGTKENKTHPDVGSFTCPPGNDHVFANNLLKKTVNGHT